MALPQDPPPGDDDLETSAVRPPPLLGSTPIHQDGDVPPARMVTQLRVCGRNARLLLSTAKRRFTLGVSRPPEVDLTLDGDGVSRLHAILTRNGAKLRVRDHGSTNGTFYRDRRDPDFEVGAGEAFCITQRIRLLALDEDLVNLRETLQWAIGLHADAAVDHALEAIARNGPLLLVGPKGCDQRALAEAIHASSPRAARDLVIAPPVFATRQEEVATLAHAARGSLYLDLTDTTQSLSGHFVAGLASGATRPIIVVRDRQHAAQCLDSYAHGLDSITLPALAGRRDDIPRMLAALLNQESARRAAPAALPLSALGPENLDGIKAYDWGGNIEELRQRAVPRLYALLTNGVKLKPASVALGRSIGALREALARFNVDVRRSPSYSREDDEEEDAAIALARSEVDEGEVLPRPPPSGSAHEGGRPW